LQKPLHGIAVPIGIHNDYTVGTKEKMDLEDKEKNTFI
jgi:hypothetical protein